MDSIRVERSLPRLRDAPKLFRVVSVALATALILAIAGCVVVPAGTQPAMSTFDRSWYAVVYAFEEQDLQISAADRSTGVVRGPRGSIEITSNVRTEADGTVRVEFNAAGATQPDPTLAERVARSYNQRKGR